MTPAPMPALLPCPMCGRAAEYAEPSDLACFVMCESCGLCTSEHRTAAEAIASWNTRTPDARAYAASMPALPAREAFERWMIDVRKCVVGSTDPYPAGIERDAWQAWQAGSAYAAALAGDACEWKVDDEWTWHGACGVTWAFTEDGPVENNYHYCHGCGQRVRLVAVEGEGGAHGR